MADSRSYRSPVGGTRATPTSTHLPLASSHLRPQLFRRSPLDSSVVRTVTTDRDGGVYSFPMENRNEATKSKSARPVRRLIVPFNSWDNEEYNF